MATISVTTVVLAARPSPAAGLPRPRVARVTRLRCSYSKDGNKNKKASSALAPVVLKAAPLLAAASAATASVTPVLALALVEVDERMSAQRTLLRDNLLGWTMLVAVGLVLSFYTLYSSILDD